MFRCAIILGFLLSGTLGAVESEPAMEVPFDLLHNQIVVQAEIESSGPYPFVLDSGTQGTTLDLALVKRLGLPLGPRHRVAAGAGKERADSLDTICLELRVGQLTMKNLPALALDLAKVSQAIGRPLAGVLGSGFLAGRITQIDYLRRRIRVWRSSPFGPDPHPPDTPRRVTVPLTFLDGSALPVFADCFVNGSRLPVTIDTGSSFGLILFPPAVAKLGLERLAQSGPAIAAAGYRGRVRLTRGWVRSLLLKTIDLGAIEVAYVAGGYEGRVDPERRGGNLGNSVLQDFTVTLDYVNRLLVLEYTAE